MDRGMYGSAALAWPKGSKIEIRLSAGFMSEFESQKKEFESKANESGRMLKEMTLAEMDVFWNEAKALDE